MKFTDSSEKISLQEIDEIETDLGISLPESYKKLMIEYNGGYPEQEYFRGESVFFLSFKYGEPNKIESILSDLDDFLPEGFFPFCDFKSAYCCICLKGVDYGKIFAISESGEYEMVSDSFESFLGELSCESDY